MRFTERELTAAVDGVAQRLYTATRPPWRRRRAHADWASLPTIDRYNRRAAVGEIVLPALQALPDRPTVGAHPDFDAHEYAEAAETANRLLLEHRTPGAWAAMAPRRRRRLIRTTAALTRTAVQSMPVRQDPDDLVVPDHL